MIPNQCTDHTALAARRFGAHVLECTVPVKSKGEVLRFAWEQLAPAGAMTRSASLTRTTWRTPVPAGDEQRLPGGRTEPPRAQDSKNPYDSVVSGCYSIYYWMMDRLPQRGPGRAGPARHGQRHRLLW